MAELSTTPRVVRQRAQLSARGCGKQEGLGAAAASLLVGTRMIRRRKFLSRAILPPSKRNTLLLRFSPSAGCKTPNRIDHRRAEIRIPRVTYFTTRIP